MSVKLSGGCVMTTGRPNKKEVQLPWANFQISVKWSFKADFFTHFHQWNTRGVFWDNFCILKKTLLMTPVALGGYSHYHTYPDLLSSRCWVVRVALDKDEMRSCEVQCAICKFVAKAIHQPHLLYLQNWHVSNWLAVNNKVTFSAGSKVKYWIYWKKKEKLTESC